MSRKYRQAGYQDESGEKMKRPASFERRPPEGPRSPRMAGLQKAMRCAACGKLLPATIGEIKFSSNCPSCSSALHTCRNCVHFDPAGRFECTQPIPERISPKDKRNSCKFFEIRSTVEKIVTSSNQKKGVDPREAFENLFKK